LLKLFQVKLSFQAGYGEDEHGNDNVLKYAEVDLVSVGDCLVTNNDYTGKAAKESFCAGVPQNRTAACPGDTGQFKIPNVDLHILVPFPKLFPNRWWRLHSKRKRLVA